MRFRPSLTWSLAFALLCVSAVSTARAQDRAETSGLSLGVGAGNESAFLGAHALYYLQVPDSRFRLAPHVGLGGVPTAKRLGYAGGLMLSFGRRHRAVLDVLAAPLAASGSTGERGKYYYGVAALVGYEWMAAYGLALRTTLGLGVELDDPGELHVGINLISIDYKFW